MLKRKDLLGLIDASAEEITEILDLAQEYKNRIKRGENVQVPDFVAEVLERSMQQDAATAALIERKAAEYEAEAKARNL